MKYTIYKTTNLLSNQFYIGVHRTNKIHDSYMGSGLYIKRQIEKYGKENFAKEILFIFDNEKEAYDKEILLVEENINNSLCLNIGPGGIGGAKFKGKKHSLETKLKNKEATLGRKWIHDNNCSKFVKPFEIDNYLKQGWIIGKHKNDIKSFRFSEESKKKISDKAKLRYRKLSQKSETDI